MLGGKRNWVLNSRRRKSRIDSGLHTAGHKKAKLTPNAKLMSQPDKTTWVKTSQLSELRKILKKARAGATPGCNWVPYWINKNCPKLKRRLLALFKVIWQMENVGYRWHRRISTLRKKKIKQLWMISPLNIERKLFLSILSIWLCTYCRYWAVFNIQSPSAR